MSDEPQEQFDPGKEARDWLYKLEALSRVNNFAETQSLFHKNCIYFGLFSDHGKKDWDETWASHRKLSIDMNRVKIICEGNLFMICAPWVATSQIHGAPFKTGRFTIGLMKFSNGKLLAVHLHSSFDPCAK